MHQLTLIPYKKNNKWGFCDPNKKIIIDCVYNQVETFYEGFAEVSIGYNKRGIIDINGKIFVPLIYSQISLNKGDSAFIVQDANSKYGLYYNGNLVIDVKFDFISYYSKEFIAVKQNDKWLIQNIRGTAYPLNFELRAYREGYFGKPSENPPYLLSENICIHEFHGLSIFINGIKKDIPFRINEISKIRTTNRELFVATVHNDKSYESEQINIAIYDATFNHLFPNETFGNTTFAEVIHQEDILDYLLIKDFNNKTYVFNEEFELIQVLEIDVTSEFSEGYAIVKTDSPSVKYGLINKALDTVLDFIYDEITTFNDGLSKVKLNGKYGFINKNFELVIDCIYDEAYSFKDGLSKVKFDEKYGYINPSGKIIIPTVYYKLGEFVDGFCSATLSRNFTNSCCLIDLNNKIISATDYSFYYGGPSFIKDKYIAIIHRAESGYGLLNNDGTEILSCQYLIEGTFTEGYARIEYNDKWGLVNVNGEIVIPFTFEKLYDGFSSENSRYWFAKLDEATFGYIDCNGNQFWE